MPKGQKKYKPSSGNTSKYYFTNFHEDAIVKFASSTDPKERNKLYADVIGPIFLEMIEKIVYKYKFNHLPNYESMIPECESHLITILANFDKNRESKAFSYFTVVARNWFYHKTKQMTVQSKKDSALFQAADLLDKENALNIENSFVVESVNREFYEALTEEMDRWLLLPDNTIIEYKVLQAIKLLFKSPDSIPIFNRKAILLYCREITKLNTKQIVAGWNKFKVLYLKFRKEWDNDKYLY